MKFGFGSFPNINFEYFSLFKGKDNQSFYIWKRLLPNTSYHMGPLDRLVIITMHVITNTNFDLNTNQNFDLYLNAIKLLKFNDLKAN